VVAKYVPPSATVIGVDLLAIKPIRNVIMLKEDITTEKCRQMIKKHMKGKKVDVVLHDGAPSMGAAWAHDAYAQSGMLHQPTQPKSIRANQRNKHNEHEETCD
jgi:AdoMet-dependent rRNA methyltransferase SPB1